MIRYDTTMTTLTTLHETTSCVWWRQEPGQKSRSVSRSSAGHLGRLESDSPIPGWWSQLKNVSQLGSYLHHVTIHIIIYNYIYIYMFCIIIYDHIIWYNIIYAVYSMSLSSHGIISSFWLVHTPFFHKNSWLQHHALMIYYIEHIEIYPYMIL